MFAPVFYTLPGDELFAPVTAYPGEDAGADIRAHVRDAYEATQSKAFYASFKRQPPTAAVNSKGHLYVDGERFEGPTPEAFAGLIDKRGGAVFIGPGQTVLVNSGFKVVQRENVGLGAPWDSLISVYAVVSRSGLACRHNVVVTNSPGIVDSGYRDWVKVSLTNNSKNYHAFTHGARIAQGLCWLVIDQQHSPNTQNEEVLTKTSRQLGGFGSTDLG